jgi:hypothetical protein
MELVVINREIDFGDVTSPQVLEGQFDVTNTSDIVINFSCTVGCGCTLPVFETQSMAPHTTQFAKVYLDTNKIGKGFFSKSININYLENRITIKLKGRVL